MEKKLDNKKWYMITTISGKEEKVIESLKNRVVSEGMENDFEVTSDVEGFKAMMVPFISQKELEKKLAGEDYKIKSRNLFPGYIFIKMNMTNDAWFLVRNTQYVTGLVGSSGQRAKPTPVSNLEIRKMEKQAKKIIEEFDVEKISTPFKEGLIVEVIDGPTKGQVGKILEVDHARKVVIVELILFERKTPTELKFDNLKLKNN